MGNEYNDPNEWAAKLKEIYDALIRQGFTKEQAIRLMVGAFCGNG